MTDREAVTVRDDGPVRVIEIHRPDVRNAVDGPTATLLYEAFRRFESDESVSVAVLAGRGGTFCSGADLRGIGEGRANRVEAAPGDEIVGSLGPMGPTRLDLGKPVIAAVEGFAVAGGLELAVWADLRVVASDAVFGVFCRRWGVPLVDGGTVRLARIVGHGRASDMILTGREVGADEAERIGLATEVCAPGAAVERAVELGRRIAAFPQSCLRSDRRSLQRQWGAELGRALSFETDTGLGVIGSGETAEGARRFADGAGRHGRFDDGIAQDDA